MSDNDSAFPVIRERAGRIQITVPAVLLRRMKVASEVHGINWSQTACRAFEAAVDTLEKGDTPCTPTF